MVSARLKFHLISPFSFFGPKTEGAPKGLSRRSPSEVELWRIHTHDTTSRSIAIRAHLVGCVPVNQKPHGYPSLDSPF